MRVLMVASEARPFSKSGGLADVVYSLSKELVGLKEEMTVILPLYQQIKNNPDFTLEKISSFIVNMNWRRQSASIYHTQYEGIQYYFVGNDYYFNRPNLYGYEDDVERFAFFSLAVNEFILRNNYFDVVHIHDWHAGMLACLMRELPISKEPLKNTKIVLSIHNPAFQGMMDPSALGNFYGLPQYLYENGQVRFDNRVSSLKTAIVYADKITTVSPNHRYELLTPEGSMGLYKVLELREYDFVGILNGIDYGEFNPKEDKFLQYPYNGVNISKQKSSNKLKLLDDFDLEDVSRPLFSMVSRITWQKGLEILLPCIEHLLNHGCNVMVLGSGDYYYEQELEKLLRKYPSRLAIYIGYNDELAHRIYGSSDFFLMPSLFEPCGLGQMIAQRYGTLPIVRYTGGLKDTVFGFDGKNDKYANGFGFNDYSVHALISTCDWALYNYQNKKLMLKLQRNALKTDNTWVKSAKEYLKLYKNLF